MHAAAVLQVLLCTYCVMMHSPLNLCPLWGVLVHWVMSVTSSTQNATPFLRLWGIFFLEVGCSSPRWPAIRLHLVPFKYSSTGCSSLNSPRIPFPLSFLLLFSGEFRCQDQARVLVHARLALPQETQPQAFTFLFYHFIYNFEFATKLKYSVFEPFRIHCLTIGSYHGLVSLLESVPSPPLAILGISARAWWLWGITLIWFLNPLSLLITMF